ncbi:DUF5073 family protein [Tsukamurella soli]|uniref:Uncharacterized protein n=1 Tax=Tsukamurella soli TaxID=644556 RepID=A0ABP8J5C2_9ACTN
MDRYDQAAATTILTGVLRQPGGGATALRAFAEVPGVACESVESGRRLHRTRSTVLRVGDWEFTAPDAGYEVRARHVIRGIAVLTETPPAAECAQRLAAELLGSAERFGPDADIATQASLYALATITGR